MERCGWRAQTARSLLSGKLVLPLGQAPTDAVEHHRQQRDDKAGEQALTELRLAHGRQHLPADVGEPADDRGDDHHAERGHGGLIDAEHDLRQCRRDLDLPEALARRAARHDRRFDDIRRYPPQPEDGVAHHRRGGVDRAGDQADDGAEPEQEEDRNEVGECRDRLHQIEGRLDDSIEPFEAERENAEEQAEADGDRHRDGDQRKRGHALVPVADNHHVAERDRSEYREPPSLRHGARECRPTPWSPATAAMPARWRRRSSASRESRRSRGRAAEVLDEPGRRGIHPADERYDPLLGIRLQPRRHVDQRETADDESADSEPGREPLGQGAA